MDSFNFFKNEKINKNFKGKSGIYIIENKLFTDNLGYGVYKIGYARQSLYNRLLNYRTAYGLIPFKIHALYIVPEKVKNKRVNFANLTERILQETARKYDCYAGIGEWFINLDMLLNILDEIHKSQEEKYDLYTYKRILNKKVDIELVSENDIRSKFKDLIVGRHTRSGDTEIDTIESEVYQHIALGSKRGQVIKIS